MATEIHSITISKWEAYQPRRDRKQHTWFRVENTIPASKGLFGLSAEQRWFWICLLATASKDQTETLKFEPEYFAATFLLSVPKMVSALKTLEARGAVTLSYGSDRLPLASLQTNKQTNKQTIVQFDFEIPYGFYPKKSGKDAGFSRLRSRITSQELFDSFTHACKAYAAECRREGKDKKFIMLFSTFVGTEGAERWLDYVPVDVTPAANATYALPSLPHAQIPHEKTITPASNLPPEAKRALAILSGKRVEPEGA